jgi:hypothetical protein
MSPATALALALALQAPATPRAPAAPTMVAKTTVVEHRAPVGHTHTCANGHTWDHKANPGHTCQFCGLSQNVQDRNPRPVSVVKTVMVAVPTAEQPKVAPVSVAAPTPAPAPVARAVPTRGLFPTVRVSSGCANGNCSYPGWR